MTLADIKKRVYALIEELNPNSQYLTNDEDYKLKINYCIDTKQNELARIKKIRAVDSIEVKMQERYDLNEEVDQFYKLADLSIKNGDEVVNYDMFGNIFVPEKDGIATIKYYKYPKVIKDDTPDTYKFELDQDVLEILPYGVAADLLKADISAQYGQVYANAYNEALNRLDIATTSNQYYISGGIDV